MNNSELRERILAADDSLTVSDILEPGILDEIPESIREPFLALGVKWGPDRSWGVEALLGHDKTITLGHKRGHHIAAHPEWAGYDEESAAEILRVEVEGTLLHELGHAVWRAAAAADKELVPMLKETIEADGPVTDYLGHAGEEKNAPLEQFAEAFRWWMSGGDDFEEQYPSWSGLIEAALDACE